MSANSNCQPRMICQIMSTSHMHAFNFLCIVEVDKEPNLKTADWEPK